MQDIDTTTICIPDDIAHSLRVNAGAFLGSNQEREKPREIVQLEIRRQLPSGPVRVFVDLMPMQRYGQSPITIDDESQIEPFLDRLHAIIENCAYKVPSTPVSEPSIRSVQSFDGQKLYRYNASECPKSGTAKDVYSSPDDTYVVAFYKERPNAVELDRLVNLVGPVREQVFARQSDRNRLNGLSCWPADVVTRSNGRIGLIVPAFPKNFFFKTTGSDAKISLCGKEKWGSWFANPAQRFGLVAPSERGDFRGMLSCCRLIALAVDAIHEVGLAHGNISTHSVLVDPVAGDALLADCDIVFKPGESASSVIGPMGFIAPEIVETCNNPQGPQVLPNQETDRHSLAVLIYSLLLCRHPLEGAAVWDEDDEERDHNLTYGEKALFIEHPTDKRNRYDWNWVVADSKKTDLSFLRPWRDLDTLPYNKFGPYLSPLVERAFVDGLHNPSARPTAAEWATALEKTIPLNLSIPN